MQYKTVTKESEVALEGIEIELEMHDNAVKSVRLRDRNGGFVKIAQGEYGGIKVLVPAPPEMVERWHLYGNITDNIVIDQLFETEGAANIERNKLGDDGLKLAIKNVMVEKK